MNKSELRQLMQAAMCGDVEAQTYLGYLYYEGEGVEQNYNEAVKWYKKAAKQDYAPAQLALGECYYFGECVEQDYKKAEDIKNKIVDIYTDNKKAVLTINFGRQNFLENLKLINNRLRTSYSYADFGYKIKKMIPNLAIKPAKLVKDLSDISGKMKNCPAISEL